LALGHFNALQSQSLIIFAAVVEMNRPSNIKEEEEPNFLKMTAKSRFFWGIFAGFLLGIGLAASFSYPPQNNYGVAIIALFACPLPTGFLFLIFGRRFARWFWIILRSMSW
jgi:hypothetical protein